MARYHVTKMLRLEYDTEAETPTDALGRTPANPEWTVVKERAKDLAAKPAGPRTISDRTYRAGRTFERKFEGTVHQAVFLPGGRVKLDGVEVFASLSKATAAIRPGVSLNSWAWWKEVEPVAKAEAASAPKPAPASAKKASKAAAKLLTDRMSEPAAEQSEVS